MLLVGDFSLIFNKYDVVCFFSKDFDLLSIELEWLFFSFLLLLVNFSFYSKDLDLSLLSIFELFFYLLVVDFL